MNKSAAALIEVIRKAQSDFTVWDWQITFSQRANGEDELTRIYEGRPDDDDTHLLSGAAREYADQVERDARAASGYADAAIAAILAGDLESALASIACADNIEAQYGDRPAYLPAKWAIETAIRAGLKRQRP